MSADTLARVLKNDGSYLNVIRFPSGLLALDSASSVLLIGTVGELLELSAALNALTKNLGPHEGGI